MSIHNFIQCILFYSFILLNSQHFVKMNPCFKLSLYEGARYTAVGDFIYAVVTITVIILQMINAAKNGLAINNSNVPLMYTRINQVLVTYLILGLVNLILAIALYRGIRTDNLQHCQTFMIVSTLSTTFGFVTVAYHGFHLSEELGLSLFNSEFFISLGYHLVKIYLLLVVLAFVRELRKLKTDEENGIRNKRRHTYQSLESIIDEEGEDGEPVKHLLYHVPFTARSYISDERLEIDYDTCVEYGEKTSTVKGTVQQTSDPSRSRQVSIKMLKSNFRTEENLTALVKEAKLLLSIGNHQHILQFFGISCISSDVKLGNVMLIFESYPSRRLDDFLRGSFENRLQNFQDMTVRNEAQLKKQSRRLGTVYENLQANFDLEPFSTINMIQWAHQLSTAMDYLHSKKVVVGNLQASSLVLMHISCVKLTNLSLSSELNETNNIIFSPQLPGKVSWRWTALECLCSTSLGLPAEFNEKTDVWSFGSTLYEIFNMGYAQNMAPNLTEYVKALKKGLRPEKPEFASNGVYNLMKTCWSQEPDDRPNFKFISLFFRQLLSTSIHNF